MRSRRPRLPLIETGQMTGHCFAASMLAAYHAIDFARSQVSTDDIQDIRRRAGVKPSGAMAGNDQQLVANALGVGYIWCCADKKKASIYTCNNAQDRSSLSYALVAFSDRHHCGADRHHCVAVATRGNQKCGLLTYEDAVAFLTRYDIAIPTATTEVVELLDEC